MVTQEILNRKGARKATDIPEGVLILLNKGEIETVNLTEWLAINQIELIKNTFPEIGLKEYVNVLQEEILQLKKPTAMKSIKAVGQKLYDICVQKDTLDFVFKKLEIYKIDTLRCYATYLVALNEKNDIKEKLNVGLKLIADKHFGVREVIWMALRPEIAKELDQSIKLLSKLTADSDENIRRFATEVIRPRGVWCKHIEALKEYPEKALPILEKLKSDESKYVQDSVGNWLNDASKTRPDFVEKLCKQWEVESPTNETKKIIKKAMRTIMK